MDGVTAQDWCLKVPVPCPGGNRFKLRLRLILEAVNQPHDEQTMGNPGGKPSCAGGLNIHMDRKVIASQFGIGINLGSRNGQRGGGKPVTNFDCCKLGYARWELPANGSCRIQLRLQWAYCCAAVMRLGQSV